jgi:hypothetical protein
MSAKRLHLPFSTDTCSTGPPYFGLAHLMLDRLIR